MKAFITSTCLSFMLLLAMTSCTNASLEESMIPVEKDSFQSLLIERGTTPITAEQAINVAKIFDLQNGQSETKASSTQYSDVYTHTNEQGDPVFYVVNRADNNGFVIVGASRKYYPILAFAENGHYDQKAPSSGLDVWIDEQIVNVRVNSTLSDSEARKYYDHWENYEKKEFSLPLVTKTINSVRDSCIALWEAQGYNCYELSYQPHHLPDDVYEDFCTLASAVSNPEYDYMTYSVLLERVNNYNSSTGNLVSTMWGQRNHFNDSIKASPSDDPYLGCTTVAIGQIMRYHEYPTNDYNWSGMHDYNATPASASMLKAIHNYAAWFLFESMSDPWTARNWFISKGYSNASFQSHNLTTVYENLADGNPVLMSGARLLAGGGHSWVCSGASMYGYSYEYSVQVVSAIPPLHYENAGSSYSDVSIVNYLYMNWGGYGANDGWFVNDNVQMDDEHNYQYYRSEVVDIYPD